MLGSLGVARLMRFVPSSVMVGFVNALAILIFLAQVPGLIDVRDDRPDDDQRAGRGRAPGPTFLAGVLLMVLCLARPPVRRTRRQPVNDVIPGATTLLP
ncbi:hypothetical protein ACIRDW_27435 [Amycolatopsis thermoflava]|uniref:hypothetical protein n=1 Tax=Amycolatopsis thermoflava TaxID=84480 RepID=UPI003802307E